MSESKFQSQRSKVKRTWSDSILLCHLQPTHKNFSLQPDIQFSSNFHSKIQFQNSIRDCDKVASNSSWQYYCLSAPINVKSRSTITSLLISDMYLDIKICERDADFMFHALQKILISVNLVCLSYVNKWMNIKTNFHLSARTRTKDKYRIVYSDHQRLELEKEFHYSRYITIRRKAELAQALSLSERQVLNHNFLPSSKYNL